MCVCVCVCVCEREREREVEYKFLVSESNVKGTVKESVLTFKYSLSRGNLLSATSLTALRRMYTLSAGNDSTQLLLDHMPRITETLYMCMFRMQIPQKVITVYSHVVTAQLNYIHISLTLALTFQSEN